MSRAAAAGRLAALRSKMARRGIAQLIVVVKDNLAYLTGFTGLFDEGFFGCGLISSRTAELITDRRYDEQAREQAQGSDWSVAVVAGSLVQYIRAKVMTGGAAGSNVAVELDVGHRLFRRLSEAIGTPLRVVDGLIEGLRRTKEPGEIEAIGRAAALADTALERVLALIRPGVRERDLALELEYIMRKSGSEGVAFTPIVASGPNGSKPHAKAGERVLAAGDLVTIDIGARWDGYCSDLTRTFALGRPDGERSAAYGAVLAAQKRAIGALRAGATGQEVDRVARAYLADAGLARHFKHGLGHGVGLGVHEGPRLGPGARGKLRVGDVVTVEPGVYVEGRFGVRIEDLLVVLPEGVHNLSRSPKGLIVL